MTDKVVLDATEALLGSCALLVASLAQEAGISHRALRSLKNKVSTQAGGPGFGDWTRILQQVASATGTDGLDTDHPFHELAALLRGIADTTCCRSAAHQNREGPWLPRAPHLIGVASGVISIRTLPSGSRSMLTCTVEGVRWFSWSKSADRRL
ncbi:MULTISPECIES: hypothetical protein [Streptomyces]|uniref:hypothetical protein n=1 Tax=Streptomyces TaxID=1883 RepID=UPI0012911AA7|nr:MULTISPECIES: hypothetical protein [Streptomyces]MBQ0953076.1 hypothetical protein [Streptomyces sp. RK76]QFX86837.1 hypothetical protein GEV49_39065 [Streptomyces sp. SYP-A7193]